MKDEDFKELSETLDANRTGLLHLDEHVFPKMFGFKDKEDYYRGANLAGRLNKIKVPTFALSALDDQMVSAEFIPAKEV